RIVLVRDRRAEEREHAVAGELRHRAAEALDLLAHQPHDLVEEELRPLRAERLRDARRAGDVRDQHGHNTPLTASHAHRPVITRPCATFAEPASSWSERPAASARRSRARLPPRERASSSPGGRSKRSTNSRASSARPSSLQIWPTSPRSTGSRTRLAASPRWSTHPGYL